MWKFSDDSGTASVPIFRVLLMAWQKQNQRGRILYRAQAEWRYTQHRVRHIVTNVGCTKPSATSWRWNAGGPWTDGEPSHLDIDACLKAFHWIIHKGQYKIFRKTSKFSLSTPVALASDRQVKNSIVVIATQTKWKATRTRPPHSIHTTTYCTEFYEPKPKLACNSEGTDELPEEDT
jgi:hypothetical protein